MQARRQNARNKVVYGAAKIGETDTTRDCMTRELPKERISLKIARKGRALLANIIWWRDNFVSVAFCSETLTGLPVSDLEKRLRQSEKKKQQLQRRINKLLGEG
jgi:hypothetical protein